MFHSSLDKLNMFAIKLTRTTARNIFSSQRYPLVYNKFKRLEWTATESDRDPKELRSKWPKPSFDIEKLTHLLDNDNHDMRKDMRKFLSDPIMKPKYNISLEEERQVGSIFIV